MGRIVLNVPEEHHDVVVALMRQLCEHQSWDSKPPLTITWTDLHEQLLRNTTRTPTPEQRLTEQLDVTTEVLAMRRSEQDPEVSAAIAAMKHPVGDIVEVVDGGPFIVIVGPFDLLRVKQEAEKISANSPEFELVADVRVGP